jgi:predicted enzyme related to lactoylglutathione lyase
VALGRATVSALRSSSDLWHGDGMKISRTLVVLDAADLEAMSTFWSAVLGGTVDKDDDWHMISVDGEDRMGIQLAPDHVPPQWPDGSPQQIHLDLFVEDIAAAHDEVMALGAKLLKAADDLAPGEGFQVYADPAGHPFCLCWD